VQSVRRLSIGFGVLALFLSGVFLVVFDLFLAVLGVVLAPLRVLMVTHGLRALAFKLGAPERSRGELKVA
jgi:hypothetical protein